MAIRTPPGWAVEQFNATFHPATATPDEYWPDARKAANPSVRRIEFADLRYALSRGIADFGAYRTDVIFLCVIYPFVGLVLARLTFGYEMLPLLFPLASGFALIGPFAAVGLNEMSRRRELGMATRWSDAFGVLRSPALGKILLLGLVLVGLFLFWVAAAHVIFDLTLGPQEPASAMKFAHDVLYTSAGWTMTIVGIAVGCLIAVVVLAISLVSFPMLLDRNVGVETAVRTSLRAVAMSPRTSLVWGLIVAAGLVIGSLPALLGLVVTMPVLGHATWHLYRRIVQW
jgi:uncharacterized membrane protein